MTARGIRNFNPGNLRRNDTKWAGMADDQTDPDFVVFKSPQYGIRALCRVLLSYNSRGINTVAQIISTYAPSSENDTAAYIEDVAHACQVSATDVLDLDSADVMRPLVRAIIRHENGSQPYSDAVIDDALRLAGISDMTPKPVMQSSTFKASTVTTIGGATAAITETVKQVQDVNDIAQSAHDTAAQSISLIHAIVHLGPWIALALVLAGMAGIVFSLYQHNKNVGV